MNAATTVPTARGDVAADDLGDVLTHEHLFVWNPEFHRNYPATWDPGPGVERAAAELTQAYHQGVRTVIDMTVFGQGRDPELIRAVAERTPVNIVTATGIYALDGLPQVVRYRGPGAVLDMPEPLIDLMESDIRTGIGGTPVRAALVKFACEKAEPDDTLRRTVAAIAEVHHRTGVPVVAHTDPDLPNALLVLELLDKHGVAAADVVLAHAGDVVDRGYLREVAQSGAYIGCDRFGMITASEADRIDTVLWLVGAGHRDQLLLSHDCASYIDHYPETLRRQLMPDWTYSHLHLRVLPALRARGLTDVEIAGLLQANPRRLLTGQEAGARHGR
ncbi:phosphotriesterase [Actinoplanes sp. N902-109]|uniref:phosphotriesterase family protein n=1 Tax=Actinoplanes sp. (strain N902-109) TaxID=649831 RepID=UPI00032946FE|nr:phosphotriesterase [Actinoplanes sp. N902-109]AGL13738.1 Aryldialkylphosphatase [Actinoplanes sp. N902-109]